MLFGLLSIFMGAFGSVFNTYSGLYLSKDNDFLLSLPIPVRTIMTARLTSVYLMGLMYSAVVSLPAVIVYLCVAPFTVSALIGGIVYVFMISLFVMVLSCALGWVVAKISLKLKNRSFITVFISLACIGLYYFFYYKAQEMIADLVANAAVYGTAIRANFQPLYVFGNAATGDWGSMALLSAFTLILFVVTSLALEKSFLSIATATGKTDKSCVSRKARKTALGFGRDAFKGIQALYLQPELYAKLRSECALPPNCRNRDDLKGQRADRRRKNDVRRRCERIANPACRGDLPGCKHERLRRAERFA